jgi:hypothetical protein
MKQTSIEWYVEELAKINFSALRGVMIKTEHKFLHDAALRKAKEMHKKECFSFYEKGADDEFNGISNNAFEYYKEKFGIEDE